jgi:hypothetical protein
MTTISLDGNSSRITCEFDEPIELDKNSNYEICLLNFSTYNSIPNISELLRNNTLTYKHENGVKDIIFPTGSFEIDDINDFIDENLKIEIRPNLTTLKVEIFSAYEIDFTKDNSIANLLGFSKQIIPANTLVESDLPVNIMKVNSIRIKCNIASGGYENKQLTNVIHEFFINDRPGEKINEIPKNLIYYPLTTNSIREIDIRIVDQDGDLIDFRNEKISIRLHIRKIN